MAEAVQEQVVGQEVEQAVAQQQVQGHSLKGPEEHSKGVLEQTWQPGHPGT